MSVLKLRRDQVVVDEEEVAKEPATAEADKPFPLRKFEPDPDTIDGEIAEFTEEADNDTQEQPKTFFQHVRFWFNVIVIMAAVLAYPVLVVASSDVGDRDIATNVDRSNWTSPWAGSAATLMEKHFDQVGWASDAPAWAPMARLTAKPAYQSAMSGALGEFIRLTNAQSIAAGRADPDLEAASRLVSQTSTGIQLRAARDALINFDRRAHRRDTGPVELSPAQLAEQLALINSWTTKSLNDIAASTASVGGNPMDEAATRAVYASKGRAVVAFILLDTLPWPSNAEAAEARTAAMQAWKTAEEFHPLIVLNGDPDGSLWGNHPASMGFLINQAQKATEAFLKASALANPPAPAPVVAPTVAAAVVAEPAPEPPAAPPPARPKPAAKAGSKARTK